MTYLVAEIGQNHQGTVQAALDLVGICADPQRSDLYGPDVGGVDAVKLTKRDLRHELTRSAKVAPYSGPQSFGPTYGEHRKALELTDEEHAEVYRYARALGLDVIETVCAPEALSLLTHFTPDHLKIASRDLTNHRLLDAMAGTGIPMIVSTGMSDRYELDEALDVITRHHERITILHCLSQYPAEEKWVNLKTIPWLADHYPYPVGYSDHTQGVWAPIAAVALGAEVVEKHVTLDRCMRGSDHAGSLERDGIYRWVRDTRLVEQALGEYGMHKAPVTDAARRKLARSVATRYRLPKGWLVTEDDIEPLSPGSGVPWPERDRVVGRWTIHEVPEKELLTATMVA